MELSQAPATQTQQPQIPNNASRIASLVRSGALKSSELPTLKMALTNHAKVNYDTAKLPRNQRVVLDKFHTVVNSAALSNSSTFAAVRRNIMADYELTRTDFISEATSTVKDPPTVLVLKRKGIRLFADGKRVALYTNEELGVTISVPYTQNGIQQQVSAVTEEVEAIEENIKVIKSVSDHGEAQTIKFANGKSKKVDSITAKHIMAVHGALNPENKKKVEDMIQKSPEHFQKIIDFAQKHTKYSINK